MSNDEVTWFQKGKEVFLQNLWGDIERNTARYHERFVQVDDDPEIVSVVKETAFGNSKSSLMDGVLDKFR